MKTYDPVLKMNWVSYFKRFCEQHGEPIKHGPVLLFADGWSYNSLNHAGPEFPPPTDPEKLRALQVVYQRKRYDLIARLIVRNEAKLQRLAGLSAAGEMAGECREYIAWLQAESKTCLQKLNDLNAPYRRTE
jgi:hypothetical protein